LHVRNGIPAAVAERVNVIFHRARATKHPNVLSMSGRPVVETRTEEIDPPGGDHAMKTRWFAEVTSQPINIGMTPRSIGRQLTPEICVAR
jgi:hypothetical protein